MIPLTRKSIGEDHVPGPERGKVAFSTRGTGPMEQLQINFGRTNRQRDNHTGAVIQRKPPDEVITRTSCAGAYQQFFEFFLRDNTQERQIVDTLLHMMCE